LPKKKRWTTCSRTAPTGILRAEVRKESGREKDRFKIRDLFADTRCSQPVLDFLAATDLGRRVPPPAEDDAQSEASDGNCRSGKKEKRRERGAEELYPG
jgi:hypothetical protein